MLLPSKNAFANLFGRSKPLPYKTYRKPTLIRSFKIFINAEKSLEIKPILEIGRTDIITEILVAGHGLSFLPDFVTEEKVKEGKLVYIDVADAEFDIWKQLIYHKNKWISRSLDALIEYIKEHEFRS